MERTRSHVRRWIGAWVLLAGLSCVPGANGVDSESGCITCHQYPGLALIESSGKRRLLHIDTGARERSDHAEVRCVACHTRIDRTPHTGFDEIECTSACHQEERERIDAIDLASAAIHEGEQTAIASIDHRSSCVHCHTIYPHRRDRHVRAIFNLHSAHMYCEVCHLDLSDMGAVSYGWGEGEPVSFTGKPFGKLIGEEGKRYLVARIGVFDKSTGPGTLIQHDRDLEQAASFLSSGARLSESEQAARIDYFHRDVVRKEIKVACSECHIHDGRLDFRALGYSDRRAETLEDLNMKGWATKYDTFYFPKLF